MLQCTALAQHWPTTVLPVIIRAALLQPNSAAADGGRVKSIHGPASNTGSAASNGHRLLHETHCMLCTPCPPLHTITSTLARIPSCTHNSNHMTKCRVQHKHPDTHTIQAATILLCNSPHTSLHKQPRVQAVGDSGLSSASSTGMGARTSGVNQTDTLH